MQAISTIPPISPPGLLTVTDTTLIQPLPDLSLLTSPTVPATLGPLPDDCVPGSTSKQISRNFGSAIGGSPVWIINNSSTFNYGLTLTKYGWSTKLLWVIEPNFKGDVTIRGADIHDGSSLLFKPQGVTKGDQPIITPILDPENPGIPIQHQDSTGYWKEWPGYMYAPKAGCYYLEADWLGGSWKINIAIGA